MTNKDHKTHFNKNLIYLLTRKLKSLQAKACHQLGIKRQRMRKLKKEWLKMTRKKHAKDSVVGKTAQADSEMFNAHWSSGHLKTVSCCAATPQVGRKGSKGITRDHWLDCSLVLVVGFLVEVSTTQGWDSTPWVGSLCIGLCFSSLATRSLAPSLISTCAG